MFGILNLKNTRMLTFAAIFLKQLAVLSIAQKRKFKTNGSIYLLMYIHVNIRQIPHGFIQVV
jgi:hypothetical protein